MFFTAQDINQLKNKNLGLARSKIGIDIPSSKANANQGKLENSIAAYWPKIRDFAVLDMELRPSVSTYVGHVEAFLTETDRLINIHMRAEPTPRRNFGYVLLGVAILRGSQQPSTLMANFNQLVQVIKPDALVYRTTLNRNITDPNVCRATGPSPWQGPGMPSMQSSFVESLSFRHVTGFQPLPLKTAELLSFSAAALITAYTDPYTPLTAACRSVTQANPKELVCQNGRYHDIVTNRNMYLETDTIRFDEWGGTFDTTIIVAYDSDCTMSTKMCLSFNTYGFTGGYVIFDVHFHYLCSAPPAFVDSKGDFGVVKWAKVNMHKNYAGLDCEKLC
ncbi:uncharacterized protein LOC135373631 isoform X1 [Ornithodoros turicata]|uniref:uncharacterized protein LOC135373631 isoform X1 n=1 Tax=Ornithodoros turicata TaxID=34597 RepID=UPI003139D6DF